MSGLQPQARKLLLHINIYTYTYASSSQFSAIDFLFQLDRRLLPLAFPRTQPASGRIPSLNTQTLGDPFLLDIAHNGLQ